MGAGALLSGPLSALGADPASAQYSRQKPKAPSNLSAMALGSSSIQLQWQDNSNNESGFEISNGVTSRTVGANVRTYTWGGLAPGTYMCFKVRSFNRWGKSAFTPSDPPYYKCATTDPEPPDSGVRKG